MFTMRFGDHPPYSHAWAALLLRILVGWVFLTEGIQKFLFPIALGYGRFEKIGIPYPHVSAPFVGVVEIACGLLLLVGLATRFAAVPLLIDISVAIATTKVPILLHQGFWPAMHEARVDFCMLLGLIAILCIAGGQISCDAKRFMDGE
jgi:putative oxidoreductase